MLYDSLWRNELMINKTTMIIDKQNGDVCFNDSDHVYWNQVNGNKYMSVTTLIHRYVQPFDDFFWSGFKALERLLPKDIWQIEKKRFLSIKKIDLDILNQYDITTDAFNHEQQAILDEWDKKKKEACERGTKMHEEIEQSFYKQGKNTSCEHFGLGGKFECRKDYTPLDLEYGVYPEYLVYRDSPDGILHIAGQIDLLIKQGNDIILADHKSSGKIDLKSHFNTQTKQSQKMLYPLNNLDDCNYSHYSLQLSTYAWMLQKINPKFVIKDLIINHYDHNGNNTLYHCNYLKKEVERMLYHYKRELILEQEREKRKRVEY